MFGNRIALTDDPGCSPVRLTPVVGVTTGAHYRMSTGHSSPAQTKNLRGPHKKSPSSCKRRAQDISSKGETVIYFDIKLLFLYCIL